MIPFQFTEMMEGTAQLAGENFDRPFRFLFEVEAPDIAGMLTQVTGEMTGTVTIDGFAEDSPSSGRIEMSPVRGRKLRYVFDFTGTDGKNYTFDGSKSINWLRSASTWTTLPGSIYDAGGNEAGTALLRFLWSKHFPGLAKSFRIRRPVRAG